MKKIKIRHVFMVFAVLLVLTGCTLPGFSTPTPFSFPTPDKTMTALFEPTQDVPATSAPDDSETAEDQATATPLIAPTNTPTPTEIEETSEPTATYDSVYAGPDIRGGASISATYMSSADTLDGNLTEWSPPIQNVINYSVWGAQNWYGIADCSGSVQLGWNEDYLFVGVRVTDDVYVQEAVNEKLYLGDSLEIVFDRYVGGDYYSHYMSSDDYQLGISPGRYGIETCYIINGKVTSSCSPEPPQAYLWAPKTQMGLKPEVKIAALESTVGYQVEMHVPWTLLGVTNPQVGDHYGFAISISDNDLVGTQKQQSMVSNVSTRFYADPTTWGDLILE